MFGLETWKRILTFSIIAAVFGVLIIIKPFQGGQVSCLIAGCGLFVEGIMNHLTVKETVKVTKRSPDQNENGENTAGMKSRHLRTTDNRNKKIKLREVIRTMIQHQNILSNVEMALTISGISGNNRKDMAVRAHSQSGTG
ncbi:MAG: hypothetical protein ACI4EG_12555 [Fusicatenibacter sp.]